MADRISGDLQIGGKITREQFDFISDMLENSINADDCISEAGFLQFHECTPADMESLVGYCRENSIPLSITWEAKWDLGGYAEFWIGGEYKTFHVTANGELCFTLEELENSGTDSIRDFISRQIVWVLPRLEISDSDESQFGRVCVRAVSPQEDL